MNTWAKPLAGALLVSVLTLGGGAAAAADELAQPSEEQSALLGKSKSKPQADRWGL